MADSAGREADGRDPRKVDGHWRLNVVEGEAMDEVSRRITDKLWRRVLPSEEAVNVWGGLGSERYRQRGSSDVMGGGG